MKLLLIFWNQQNQKKYIFFIQKKNDDELLEKCKGIRYYPIEDAKELETNLEKIKSDLEKIKSGFNKGEMAIFNPKICNAMPYITDSFYEEYLNRFLNKTEEKYQKKTMLALCNAYNDYQHSIKKDQSSKIKKKMLKFLARNFIPLSDKYNIIDIISKGDLNLDEDDITELLSFTIKNEDVLLYNFLVFSLEANSKLLQEYIKNLILDQNNFFEKVKNANNIEDLINTFLREKIFDGDSINAFLEKLEELSKIVTRSKNDERTKYVDSFTKFIRARLKQDKKQDLLAFCNWQTTEKNLKNQYSLIPAMSAIIFEEFIEKDTTINWILQTENLLNTNIIEFFASEKVPLEKKIKFLVLDNTKKNIINSDEYYSRLDAALLELTSSEEGQKIYLKIITDENAAKISSTILALVYGFFNYTEQEEIKNNTRPILNNFKTMNHTQQHFVLNYGDKKFIAFLNFAENQYKELNKAKRDQ